MTTVGDSLAAIQIPDADGEVILVSIADGKVRHFVADRVSTKPLDRTLYIASGTFAPGSVSEWAGRIAENVQRILWLPFDCDLTDFLGLEPDQLHGWDDAAIETQIGIQREVLEEAFGHFRLPIHRLDYTGYGLCAYIYLPTHEANQVAEIRSLHKAIIDRINGYAKMRLVDPQVSDAGTRITRLPGSPNTKGTITRISRTLYQRITSVTEGQLRDAAGQVVTSMGYVIPKSGGGLPGALVTKLIDAIQPHWTPGNRHALAMAVAGRLAKAGVPEEQAAAIVGVLAAGDDEPWDRQRAVQTSYDRARSGLLIAGYTALLQLVPASVVDWLDGELTRWLKPGIRVTVGGSRPVEEATTKPAYVQLPAACLTGWIGRYAELMRPTTEAPVCYHWAVGMTLAGQLMGRRVHLPLGTDPVYANLYTLLIGSPGETKKDTSIKRATRRIDTGTIVDGMTMFQLDTKIVTDIASSEGLIGKLSEFPHLLMYVTEFTKLMSNARRQSTSTIVPTLIESWDCPPVLSNMSKGNPLEAKYPYLSIVAATQPDTIADTMTTMDLKNGFASRWLFVYGEAPDDEAYWLPFGGQLEPGSADSLMVDLMRARAAYREGQPIELDEAARKRWADWYVADKRAVRQASDLERHMRARHGAIALKLALINAASEGHHLVSVEHLDAALEAVAWSWTQLQALLPSWGGTIDTKIEARIVTLLTRGGSVHRRNLQQNTRGDWGAPQYNRVLRSLLEEQRIEVDPAGYVTLLKGG